MGKENASSALARNIAEVNIVVKGTTKIRIVLVRPQSGVEPLIVVDESTVVETDLDCLVVISLEEAAIQTLDEEFVPAFSFGILLSVADETLDSSGLRLGIRVRSVILLLLIVAILPNVELREFPRSNRAVVGGAWSVTSFEVFAAISVVPVGHDESHVALNIVRKRVEVFTAVSLHLNDFGALLDRSSNLVQVLVVVFGNKVGLDLEPVGSVDHGATGAEGIHTVLFSTLVSHLVVAHGLSRAVTVGTWVRGNIETVWVRLHNIDGGAVRVTIVSGLNVTASAESDEVDASNTATVHVSHSDPVVDGTTTDVGGVGVIVSIESLVLEHDRRVSWHDDGPAVFEDLVLGVPVASLEVLHSGFAIMHSIKSLVLGLSCDCNQTRANELLHLFVIIINSS